MGLRYGKAAMRLAGRMVRRYGNPGRIAGAVTAAALAKQINPFLSYNGRPLKRKLSFGSSNIGGAIKKALLANARSMFTPNTKRMARRMGAKKYVTTGRYTGRFRRGRRVILPKVNSHTIKTESGGTVSDPHAVYVGIATPYDQVTLGLCRCIVKELFRQAGDDFLDFDQYPFTGTNATDYRIYFAYYAGYTDDVLTEYNVDIDQPNITTYADIAVKIRNDWGIRFNDASTAPIWHIIKLFVLDNDTLSTPIGTINCGSFSFGVKDKGTLAIQNRTLSGSTDEDKDLVTNVSNNPIYGKSYFGTKNHNGFVPVIRLPGSNTMYLIGGKDYGIISGTYTQGGDAYKKPPRGYTFLATREAKAIRVNPGNIKKSVVYFSWYGTMNKYFLLMHRYISDSATNFRVPFGRASMVGFEKMLDSRVDEPDVSVGFEANHVLTFNYIYKRQRPNVINLVEEPPS